MIKVIVFYFTWYALGGLGAQGTHQPSDIQHILKQKGFLPEHIPSSGDWVYFMKSSYEERKILWHRHPKLSLWSWGWRLGWIKTCSKTKLSDPWCQTLLKEALQDNALVVRAEAAKTYGLLYRQSLETEKTLLDAIQALTKAYGADGNQRHGKPLFVQAHILRALWLMNQPKAHTEGQWLASTHPITQAYWARLKFQQRRSP